MADKFDDGFSEMVVMPPSAGMGHNKGPKMLPVGAELEERLTRHYKEPLDRATELSSKEKSFKKVNDPESLKRATEYVRQIQECMTVLNGAVDIERAPYNVALGQVRGILRSPFDVLVDVKKRVEGIMTTYNAEVLRKERLRREEEARKKREAEQALRRVEEEAKRKADEERKKAQAALDAASKANKPIPAKVVRQIDKADEAQRVANQIRDRADDASADRTRAERAVGTKAADLTRARSPNAVQSGQEFIDFRDLDKAKIDLEAIRSFLQLEHIQQAMRAYIASNELALKEDLRNRRQPLRGVEFFINLRTRVGG